MKASFPAPVDWGKNAKEARLKRYAMDKKGLRTILALHLSKYRNWTYALLADRVDQDRKNHDCLEYLEGSAPDGTHYAIEIQALWDDKPDGDVRVIGDLTMLPQKWLFGFLPIFTPDVMDSFIMRSDGSFVGEEQH